MRSRNTFLLTGILSVSLLVAVVGLPEWASRMSYAIEAGEATAVAERLAGVRDLSTAFRDVATAAKPSVVSIRATQVVRAGRSAPFGDVPMFDSRLRDFFGDRFPVPSFPDELRRTGQGSGVIISDDGYILTNNHVVADAKEIVVRLSDDREKRASIVGADPKTDLAVVKIEASGLHPAKFGDSDALEVGEWVLAIGSPFGLRQTLTAGIVSAKGRANMGIVDYENFIQTDAAINPGNSGGPLLNLRGEVVGINTAIFSRSGGYMGIGFSIPVNMAERIQQRLIEDGKVTRGYLGVMIRELDEERVAKLGLEENTGGVLVDRVVDAGPAAKAGLLPEDVILGLDGTPVSDVRRLRERVAAVAPGKVVELEILRAGKRRQVKVDISELPAGPRAAG